MELQEVFMETVSKKIKVSINKKEQRIDLLQAYGKDIMDSVNFKQSANHAQHGTMSVYHHSINIANYSLAWNHFFRLGAQDRDLIRGALLHDYFLYDWHTTSHARLHGFFHPGIALENACAEYELTEREKDIIKKHMWPLTIIPPQCREAWIVTLADKYCSLLETIRIHNRKYTQDVKNSWQIY